MNTLGFTIFLIATYVFQLVFSTFQQFHFRKKFTELGKKGWTGYAVKKGFFRGYALLLTVDDKGSVIEAHLMKGATLFSRLHPVSEWHGKTLPEVETMLSEKPLKVLFEKASEHISEQFSAHYEWHLEKQIEEMGEVADV